MKIAVNAMSQRKGGGLQVILGLISGFSDDVDVLVLWSDEESYEFLRERCQRDNVQFVCPIQTSNPFQIFLWCLFKQKSFLQKARVECVIGINHHYPSDQIYQITYHLNVMRFERVHGRWFELSEIADKLRDWRARSALRYSDINVFESRLLRELAERKIGHVKNPDVIYIGISDSLLMNQLGHKKEFNNARILSVTSSEPHKDNLTLIRMLSALVRMRPEVAWSLAIAGNINPSERRRLESLAADEGVVSGLEILGFRSHEELQALGGGALCMVSASKVESFCMVALEAMSWGCPPVLSDCSSMPESVGDAGLLAIPGDADSFAACVATLHDQPETRSKLVENGYARVNDLTWKRAALQFESRACNRVSNDGILP